MFRSLMQNIKIFTNLTAIKENHAYS